MAVSKGGVKMPRISTGRKSVLMTADPYHTPGFVVCLSSSRIRSDYTIGNSIDYIPLQLLSFH